jgi:small subunit ribosomal protein S4
MSRYTGPKARLVRRLGVNIFESDKYAKILEKRPTAPGMHGASRTGKASEYKKQLLEKQKLRFMFGVTEKQLGNYYKKASASEEATDIALMKLMERRLDNAVFKAGFAKTRAQARQMVSHGVFMLNGKRVDVPSIQVNVGDKMEVREKMKSSPLFNEVKEEKDFDHARWLKSEQKGLKFEVVALPEADDLDKLIEAYLIVEFYSK